jgi:hypothetical protein
MFTNISRSEVASSDGFTVVKGDYLTGIRYVEGDHRIVFGWTDRIDGNGVYHCTLCVTGAESWEPAGNKPALSYTQRDAIIRRVLAALHCLGLNPELAETSTWVRDGEHAVESSHGFTVSRVGATEIRYEDHAGRVMKLEARSELVAAWPVLRIDLGAMGQWLPPYDNVAVTDLDRTIVMKRLVGAFRQMGVRSVEFVNGLKRQ